MTQGERIEALEAEVAELRDGLERVALVVAQIRGCLVDLLPPSLQDDRPRLRLVQGGRQ